MSLAAGYRLGPYEILSAIGAGGMGEVYRALDTRLQRDVAIKILPELFAADADRIARFQREAQVLASLNHPHVAQIYGVEEAGDTHALVLELVEGLTLADRIAQGPIPIPEALAMAKQIAEALEAAHEQGIIHRDLKPANIKLTKDGTVKVLDFGLAKLAQASDSGLAASNLANSPTLTSPAIATHAGIILGTAAYMSPEQARGKPVDRRADVWAFGCVLYEMLTGRRAFDGRDVSELLASVIKSDPLWTTLPAGLPPVLSTVLRRCLEKEPKGRMQAIGDVRLALEGALEPAVHDAGAAAPRSTSSRLWMAAAAVASVVAVIVSMMHFREAAPAAVGPQTLRYQIDAPDGERVSQFAPAPDGQHLAFVTGVLFTPSTRLWIRQLDSLEARPVRGAEGAANLSWSPDSRSIAFIASGNLGIVDLLGSPPRTVITGANATSGVAWNRNDMLVFTRTGAPQLFRVGTGGGDATPVTVLEAGEGAHLWPQFLPDGRHFLYTALNTNSANSAVYVAALDSGERKRLLASNTKAQYVEDGTGHGYLLFARDGTLLAQRFDAGSLELQGDPFPVAENVAVRAASPTSTVPVFSVSDHVLAYQTGGTSISKELVWYDRAGRRLSTVGEPADYSNPALSRDETRLAISRMDPQLRTRDVWVIALDRGASSRLTFDRRDDLNPIWSPDGRQVAFTSDRKKTRDIYLKNANGTGDDQMLFEGSAEENTQDWSPDGRHILCAPSGGSSSSSASFVLPLEGERKPISLPRGDKQRVSPDGRWLAYQSTEPGRSDIYVQSFPDPLAGRSGGIWQVSTSGGDYPEWRRDGSELYYLAPDNTLMAVSVKGSGPVFEAAVPTPLFRLQVEAVGRRAHYQPAANGQRFLVVQPQETRSSSAITVVVNWAAALAR